MVKLLIDSASDYSYEEANKMGIYYVPITVTFDNKSYRAGIDIDYNTFYDMLINNEAFPKTAQPSPEEFVKIFEQVKEKDDELICLLMSSELSGTIQSAHLAKDIVGYDKIHIIDTLSVTYPIKVMIDYAYKLVNKGVQAADIITEIESIKSRVKVYAVLDTLEYLHKGGRLSRTAATIGELANLKPLITITEEGKVAVFKKCIGKNKALCALIKAFEDAKPDPNFPIYSVYTYGEENCTRLENKLSEINYSTSDRLQVGSAIGSHIGPNAYGIVLVKNKE